MPELAAKTYLDFLDMSVHYAQSYTQSGPGMRPPLPVWMEQELQEDIVAVIDNIRRAQENRGTDAPHQ